MCIGGSPKSVTPLPPPPVPPTEPREPWQEESRPALRDQARWMTEPYVRDPYWPDPYAG